MTQPLHMPVMPGEIEKLLAFDGPGWILDATLGMGGHASLLLEASPEADLLGLDRDPEAIETARENLERFGSRVNLVHSNYENAGSIMESMNIKEVRSILLDLGVSSRQLTQARRGFSIKNPGPLDMRMDNSEGKTLAQLLSKVSERNLADAIKSYGQERRAKTIARRIIRDFERGCLENTGDLAKSISSVCGPRRKSEKTHPATRTFQALRILVNRELEALEKFLECARELLGVGGCIAVITFHSLEDTIVKRWFAYQAAQCRCPPELPVCRCGGLPYMRLLTRGAQPSESEQRDNPRSRSARLRAAVRLR